MSGGFEDFFDTTLLSLFVKIQAIMVTGHCREILIVRCMSIVKLLLYNFLGACTQNILQGMGKREKMQQTQSRHKCRMPKFACTALQMHANALTDAREFGGARQMNAECAPKA